jgi:hypothetical protein
MLLTYALVFAVVYPMVEDEISVKTELVYKSKAKENIC